MGYQSLGSVVPGITLLRTPRSKYLIARIYNKQTQQTINRSTGKETEEEARAFVLSNLGDLFGVKSEPRGGGSSSIQRLLADHLEWQRSRMRAGAIAESTYEGYGKSCRHFMRWFALHGFKKIGDIKRSSLLNYGLDRVNEDGMSPNTVNFEIVFIRMFWRWLQDEEILDRPLRVNSVTKAVENRIGGDPFKEGDLKLIHKAIEEWIKEDTNKNNFGNNQRTSYNKTVFKYFLLMLEESGFRQHELIQRTWKDVVIGETLTDRKRIINRVTIPHKAKRGARVPIFMGQSLIDLKRFQKQKCVNFSENDYLFRGQQTNTPIDMSTFSRYWTTIRNKAGVDYKLHTYRSHRITQLILGGNEPALVARNLGLSVKQIEKTYLRFIPASHFEKLVQQDIVLDTELRRVS